MTRRSFLATTGTLVAAPAAPQISITMDDVNWAAIPQPFAARANRAILQTLEHHKVRAALFPSGKNVDNETGEAIVKSWAEAGHTIGSHTYSHRMYSTMTFDQFSSDAARGEQTVGRYVQTAGLFRFPALKEGETAEKRDRMRAFMQERGWRNGHVTVDASDWYYNQRLLARLQQDPAFDPQRFREAYLNHLLDRAHYYDGLARTVMGRSPRHTLLVHYNLINVLFLDDAMQHLARYGWTWISANDAFEDPVFTRAPKTVPAGESLIWAIAKETGKFDDKLRYPGEDDVYEKAAIDRI